MDELKLLYLRKLAKKYTLRGNSKIANKVLVSIAKNTGLSTPRSDLSYSAIMRELHKKDSGKMESFMKAFKNAFDNAYVSGELDDASETALMEAMHKIDYDNLSKTAATKEKRILLIGDSLAAGLSRRLGELSKKSGLPYKAIYASGTTIAQWINKTPQRQSLEKELEEFRPTHVLISLGTNDAYSKYTGNQISQFSNKLQNLIKSYGATPLWIGTPSLPEVSNKTNINYDLLSTIRGNSSNYFDSEKIDFQRAGDNVHATPKGYKDWADEIWKWVGVVPATQMGSKTTNLIPGYKRLVQTPSQGIQDKASAILRRIYNKPWGTRVPFEYEGVHYIGVLEEHVGGRVAGPHPGISVFVESSPKKFSSRTSNILSGLDSKFKPMVEALLRIAYSQGMNPELVSGYRTLTEQQRIYEQGRSSPGEVVSDAKPGISLHNYKLAVDIAAVDGKGNIYYPDKEWYDKLSKIAKQLGMWWGGDWGKGDIGHFQYPLRADQVKSNKPDKFGLYPVRGLETTNDVFKEKLIDISRYIGINPNWLAKVISFESGFNPAAVNSKSKATGLIQWLPSVAETMFGIPKEEASEVIKRIPAIQQLDMVKKFFEPHKGRLHNLNDVYLAVFMPSLIGKPSSYIVARRGSKAYEQNKGFDRENKGYYTIGDITSTVQSRPVVSKIKPKEKSFFEDIEEFSSAAIRKFLRFLNS